MDDFEKELKEEGVELTAEYKSLVGKLSVSDSSSLQDLYRIIHTLKGSGQTADFTEFGGGMVPVEEFIGRLKDGAAPVNAPAVDFLQRLAGTLEDYFARLKETDNAEFPSAAVQDEIDGLS